MAEFNPVIWFDFSVVFYVLLITLVHKFNLRFFYNPGQTS